MKTNRKSPSHYYIPYHINYFDGEEEDIYIALKLSMGDMVNNMHIHSLGNDQFFVMYFGDLDLPLDKFFNEHPQFFLYNK